MSSLFNRLKNALVKTSDKISSGIDHIFFKKKLDVGTLEELEELLISTDIGTQVAANFIDNLKLEKFDKEIDSNTIKQKLAEMIDNILIKHSKPFILKDSELNIVLVCGVNGNGKTTTIGKLAAGYIKNGKKVSVAACDTFRAAAIDQLAVWANRAGAVLFTGDSGSDPASVAYNAIIKSKEQQIDILFIDTAGRLHNYKNLMDELAKIIRVIKKIDETAPHHSLLVIDATTGQNAYNQVEQFKQVANISGLVVTKLDGTAKAGVVVGIMQKFLLPVYFIGVGEKIEDLREFNSIEFSRALLS